MPSTPSDATIARRLSYSSRQAGQPSRWARSPGISASASRPARSSSTKRSSSSKHSSHPTSGAAGPRSRPYHLIDLGTLGHRSPSREVLSQLATRVVQRLVEGAAGGRQAIGEDVDRNAVQRERDEHATLVRRQHVGDRNLQRREQLAVVPPARPARGRRSRTAFQLSGSSGTSRPCQARLRSFTAASSSANLYAHVVKRLAPRKSSSRASTLTSASFAASWAISSSSPPRR